MYVKRYNHTAEAVSHDVSRCLGRCKMPEGYKLLQLDSGHFMWRHEESDEESSIHWNKWAIYHGAHANNKERSKP